MSTIDVNIQEGLITSELTQEYVERMKTLVPVDVINIHREEAPDSDTDKLVHECVISSWNHDTVEEIYEKEEDLLEKFNKSEMDLSPVFRVTAVNEP